MTLSRLNLKPTVEGFTVQSGEGGEVISVSLDGGQSRQRLDIDGAVRIVTVRFALEPDQVQYLEAFFNRERANAFELSLPVDDSAFRVHEARLVPGSRSVVARTGPRTVYQMTLEVKPIARDAEFDDSLLLLFGLYDDPVGVINAFDNLANVRLPAVGTSS